MVFQAVLILVTVAVVSASNDNLKAVVQIFRHGQRTPVQFLPSDPYKDLETYWGGLEYGQLTNEGKRQHFRLGQFTRNRYADWLPLKYSEKDIRVQSTDVDRTLMSAQANLYGLYRAIGSQVWRKGVDWQPIPIHIADTKIFSAIPSGCPLFEILYQNFSKKPDLDKTYAYVYKYISNHTRDILSSYAEAFYLWDSLVIEEAVGFELPAWTSQVYPQPLTHLALNLFEVYSSNTQLQRLGTGLFLHNIIEYFEKMLTDPKSSQKYQMYSGHDINVFSILNTLGLTPVEPIPFAASLWFELRKAGAVPFVQLWMKSKDTFSQLSIRGCELDCPLTELKSRLSDVLIDINTWNKECNSV